MQILYPVRTVNIVNPFGAKAKWYGKDGHRGVDFMVPEDTKIQAVMDGKVVQVVVDVKDWFFWDGGDWQKTSDYGKGDNYGNNIIIEHSGYYSVYGHCSKVLVKVGDSVKIGQDVAISGNTGHSMGNHLHFELRMGGNSRDNCIDPLPFMTFAFCKPSWAIKAYKWIANGNKKSFVSTKKPGLWVRMHKILRTFSKK